MGSKYKTGRRGLQKSHEDDAKKSESVKRSFEFPANVKQMGGLNRGIKIYIEDYAHSFINRIGAEKGDTAVYLIGFKTTELGEDILVISGAVSPPGAKAGAVSPLKGDEAFSENDRKYTQSIIDKYFKGLGIVGWARIQPGYGLYLSSGDINSHYNGFTDKHSVLFLCDPEEKLDCFYQWNENQDDLEEASGYFVYYDRNNEMNAYAAESNAVLTVEAEVRSSDSDFENPFDELSDDEEEETISLRELRERLAGKAFARDEERPLDADADGLQKSIDNAKRIAEIHRQKRIIRMMTSISALLFFACVVMGIGLMQSGERISLVETQTKELRNGYNNIVSRLNDSAFPAFAAQSQESVRSTEDEQKSGSTIFYLEDAEKNVIPQNTSDANQPQEASQSNDESGESGLDKELGISVTQEPETSAQEDALEASAQSDVSQEAQQTNASLSFYFVQSGDTLSFISQKFYGTPANIDAIMSANGISDPDKLVVGAKLIIP